MAADHIPSPEASINSDALKPGQYKVIGTDGSESIHIGKPTIRAIQLLIGCDGLDHVTIDRRRQTVMFVDDTGMIDGKQVNAKATTLYHAVSVLS
jgi:prenyltransferase beta subunit